MSKKILLVDDDASLCAVMRDILLQGGHEILTASDEAQALEKAAQSPDLIVLDLMLPGVDGWEILRRLKSEPKTRAVPVIICSTVPGKEASAKARELGAVDFLPKPFGLAEFSRRVEQALSHGS